jgi:transcriptional regulator with XRE-family HTH domain
VAQRPAELTPLASTRHFFGAELRYWRNRRGLSLAQLGRVVYASADMIGKVEKAQRWPSAALVDQFEAVLDTAGILRRLYALAEDEQRTSSVSVPLSGAGSPALSPALVVIMAGCADDTELSKVLEQAGIRVSAASVVGTRQADDPAAAVVDLATARAHRTNRGATRVVPVARRH